LILGAHGTLLEPPPGVDAGLKQTQDFMERLAKVLSPKFAHTTPGWLNHTIGGKWTTPDLETAVKEATAKGISKLVYYPYGFLADNAESELEGRCILRQFNQLETIHLPCVNTWAPFLEYLAGRILQRLKAEG